MDLERVAGFGSLQPLATAILAPDMAGHDVGAVSLVLKPCVPKVICLPYLRMPRGVGAPFYGAVGDKGGI